jgi:hypothetical protein
VGPRALRRSTNTNIASAAAGIAVTTNLGGWRRALRAGLFAVLAAVDTAASPPAAALPPDLLAKAHERGVVQVIVTLRVPEGASAATMGRVKQAVLDDIASTRHRLVYALPTLPQLVIDASEETLRALAASPNVRRIDESVARRPSQ